MNDSDGVGFVFAMSAFLPIDTRAFDVIIKGHLLMEIALDNLISAAATKPEALGSNLPFSKKIDIYEAFYPVKTTVNTAPALRSFTKLRNQAAHELIMSYDICEGAYGKFKGSLRELFNELRDTEYSSFDCEIRDYTIKFLMHLDVIGGRIHRVLDKYD